jgi:N-acetylneuraminic acid mutarotase
LTEIASERIMNFGEELTPRSGHSATLIKNFIYIFGGLNEEGKEMNEMLMFDIKSSSLSTLNTKGIIPKARSAHACCKNDFETLIYIHGGGCSDGTVHS